MIILLLLLAVAFIVLSTTRFNLHPFRPYCLPPSSSACCQACPLAAVATAIQTGFGNTLGSIGILIIAGTIIGVFLEKSGGAFALAERLLRLIGQKNVSTAMALIGWIVAIPVFSDSGFVILTPLNRALTKKAGLSLAGTAVALGLGLSAAHALVPSHPRPHCGGGHSGGRPGHGDRTGHSGEPVCAVLRLAVGYPRGGPHLHRSRARGERGPGGTTGAGSTRSPAHAGSHFVAPTADHLAQHCPVAFRTNGQRGAYPNHFVHRRAHDCPAHWGAHRFHPAQNL